MTETLILPNEFLSLAEEELKMGRSVRILADGASMQPFIRGNKDYAEIFPLNPNEELKLWEAYLYKYNGKYMIHRFIGEKNGELIMMGDGNLKLKEIINRDDVIGNLKFLHRGEGKVIDCTTKKWKRNGRIWNYFLPLRRYLLAVNRRLYRYGIKR